MFTLKDKYVFPAVFNYAQDGITVFFPDLPGCITSGNDTEEALKNAREALELYIFGLEHDNEVIPEPSDILCVEHDKNQAVVLIDAFMPNVRDAVNNKAVNKMVTLPQWLITAGKEADLNFSHILQDALMDRLGISRGINRRRYSKRY